MRLIALNVQRFPPLKTRVASGAENHFYDVGMLMDIARNLFTQKFLQRHRADKRHELVAKTVEPMMLQIHSVEPKQKVTCMSVALLQVQY